MTYLNYIIQETLRINPIVTFTSPVYFEKDTKIGGFVVKGGTAMAINIHGLHRNASQWQRPDEFLPDRFDSTHPLSRTPSGEKRHAFSWLPFNGGRRVCFGKTFAEAVLKITITLVTQGFDLSFVDKEKYRQGNLPMKHIGQSHYPEILVDVAQRADQ